MLLVLVEVLASFLVRHADFVFNVALARGTSNKTANERGLIDEPQNDMHKLRPFLPASESPRRGLITRTLFLVAIFLGSIGPGRV